MAKRRFSARRTRKLVIFVVFEGVNVKMGAQEPTIIFLGNGRCYHTLDWFRSAQTLRPEAPPVLATDLIESESFVKLIRPGDQVERLLVLDPVLLRKQSRFGDMWRNLLKLLVLPLQVPRLRRILKRHANPVVHAHSMYYVALARLAGCRYVATPQGSEFLVRPFRSSFYKWFSAMALSKASAITVDSEAMRSVSLRLYGRDAHIVQNGIDLDAISRMVGNGEPREQLVSIRGYSANYQIHLLLGARNRELAGLPIRFCYPFVEMDYKAEWTGDQIPEDQDIGRLPRLELYRLLAAAKLVVSIPVSDSSPRSVYEAIFCGAAVAVTPGPWISALPACMVARLIVVNPASPGWLADAWRRADELTKSPYVPTSEALDLFDQKRSMQRFYEGIYPLAAMT